MGSTAVLSITYFCIGVGSNPGPGSLTTRFFWCLSYFQSRLFKGTKHTEEFDASPLLCSEALLHQVSNFSDIVSGPGALLTNASPFCLFNKSVG